MDPTLKTQWDSFARSDLDRTNQAPTEAQRKQEEQRREDARQRQRGLVSVTSNGTMGRLWVDPCTGKPAKETFVGPAAPKPLPPPPMESPMKFDGVYGTVKLGAVSATVDSEKGFTMKTEARNPRSWLEARAAVGACVAPKDQRTKIPVGVKMSNGMVQGSVDLSGRACLGVGPSTPGMSLEFPGGSAPLTTVRR